MKSIKDQYGIEKAAVMAVQAGNDIILQDYQSDPELTFRAALDAVRTGELSLDQIDDSVRRILQMKERFGLLSNARLSLEEAKEILQAAEHVELAKEIAGRSITVLEKRHLPLRPSVQAKTLLIATRSIEEGKEAEDMGTRITGKSAYFLHRLLSLQHGHRYCGRQ